MFAFIQNGVVSNLFENKPLMAPGALLVECGPDVQEDWIYSGGTFSAPPAIVPTKSDLITRVGEKWADVLFFGTVTVGGFQSQTDDRSRGFLNGAVAYAQNDPTAVILWHGVSPITKDQLVALGIGVAEFVQAAFNAAGSLKTGITAGTVTTFAQIDAAAWPVSN